MKKLFKRKLFWAIVIVVIVIVAGLIYFKMNQASPIQYTTEPVKRGDLLQTVSATGEVESAKEINLNFQLTGRLTYLSVKEGDDVKSEQVLARLDASGAAALLEQYRANLLSAQADLAKVKAGASPEDVQVTQEQVSKATSDLDNLKIESANQLEILKEKNLDALNNSVFTAGVALDKVYNYLINDTATRDLQVNNITLQNKLENDYPSLKNQLNSAKGLVDLANKDKTDEAIVTASDKMRLTLSALNSFLNDSFSLADAIIVSSSYSQTTKDTVKTDVSTQQSTNNTSLTTLQTAKSNLVNTKNSYNSQLSAAENNLAIYRAQLNLKQAGARDFEIQAAEARVAQAQAQLSKASSDLESYVIKAPIDGKITKVNFKVGEQTGLTEPVIQMLGNEKYEIKVDIAESDITKIKIGNQVSIELDAFGSDHPFSGAVTFIDPAQTVIKDVTYYKTTVSFNQDSWNDQIKPGMTANITIKAAEKKDVLFIPQRSVRLKEAALGEVAQKFVSVLVDGQEQEKTVEVGLRGDNGLVEVISGLNENEQVVTFKKDNSKK